MHKVLVIARREYRVNVRRKGFIIMTSLVPVLGALGLIVASFFGGEARQVIERAFSGITETIGVVDHTGRFSTLSPDDAQDFVLFDSEAEGRRAVENNEISALLIVPADYMTDGAVSVLSKGGGFAAAVLEDSDRVRRFFVVHLVPEGVDPDVRRRAADPFNPVFVDLDKPEAPESESPGLSLALNMIVPYALSMLLVTTIFVASGYLLRSVAEEKTSRVIEVILSSVTPQELLAGKVLGLGALGLTQVIVWLLSATVLSGGLVALLGVTVPLLTRPDVLVLSVVYYALGFLIYAVAMGSVGALGTTMHESQQLAGIFSLMAAVPLMLAGVVFSNPNWMVARALSWFPLTAPTMMLLRL
ncbi:MAG: ABC transporter permease, partial [Anaerolineae bacterium]